MSDLNDTIDVHCVDDFLPSMPAVSGHVVRAQRLARRLTTPRGRLPYWPEFGYDLRQVLLSKRSPHVVAAAVEAECLKDEQVESVEATLSVVGTAMILVLAVADAGGPFEFTLTITEAAATLSDLLETV